jgi:RHS Repeat
VRVVRGLRRRAVAGLPTSVTYPQTAGQPVPGAERYEYDARGNLSAVVTPRGNRTTYLADALGRETLAGEGGGWLPLGDGRAGPRPHRRGGGIAG